MNVYAEEDEELHFYRAEVESFCIRVKRMEESEAKTKTEYPTYEGQDPEWSVSGRMLRK